MVTIGVLGAGSMGRGIAQLAAQAGFQVLLSDVTLEVVEKAVDQVGNDLGRLVEKGKMSAQEKDAILGRITKQAGFAGFASADFIIEAIYEDVGVKKEAFAELDQVCRPDVILASNTSSISITTLAAATKRPEQVVGMHFFNPAPVMRLVEVIRGYATSDATVARTVQLARKFGKTPIEVKKDSPGFVVNRLMLAQYVEAIKLLEEGVASKEDIDAAIKLGLNHPMGPFELHDFSGTDIGYFTLQYLADEFRESRWNPPQALKQIIRAGRLGRKSGAGWYDYK